MKIDVHYTLTAPLSHIGETASTGTYFNMIKTPNGRLPVITGNSIRGQIRDAGAAELLQRLGVQVDKETFHVLFSGGNVAAAMRDDIVRALAVREHFPLVSLLGGALGTMIMSGKLLCGFAYPICAETAEMTGAKAPLRSWHDMIDEIEFTRTDDAKNDKFAKYVTDIDAETSGQASQQMRYSVQYMAAGTEFTQRLVLLPGTTDAEIGALMAALKYWWSNAPRLGGMAAKGFGMFNAEAVECHGEVLMSVYNGSTKISEYAENMSEEYTMATNDSAEWLHLLKGSAEDGKKANKSAKSRRTSEGRADQ